ncbi:hypothetical protein [Bdellovibrio sp. ZAP7]|uniref:hypothetical protein n=1 Tax=Bdellovibrio sp. ZAP7 TaxID=2231053 RepID=UPI00115B5C43|nr:hypothetical protein [Bdellovibrio sp. ZAP7]
MVEIEKANLVEAVKKLIFEQIEFKKFGVAKICKIEQNDQLLLIDIGETKVVLLDDGQLEIYGPIYNCYIERLDYSSIDEAISKLRYHLEYIESHYDELLVKPFLNEPIFDVWLRKIKSVFKFWRVEK